ncbi:metallophosphoesterase [Capsaspora owczarzaki ATCC 30864]|uniref:metallophosphoesterase n=1 Tax=Capsaspora owczarzaki (strain ATCC 30864) TaxID=595528 RepID=UPI0001FE6329|nr:metallophosphoesterase [Capsaspora owczarzaki ATCC 30864]|eukprot:XP_004365032.1 metallophosphoesterase [Capsaspora owczarzaki ATCC 30864]
MSDPQSSASAAAAAAVVATQPRAQLLNDAAAAIQSAPRKLRLRITRITRQGLPWFEWIVIGMGIGAFELYLYSLPPPQRRFAFQVQLLVFIVAILLLVNRYIWRRLILDTRLAATKFAFARVLLGVFSVLVVLSFPLGRIHVYSEPGLLTLVAYSCLGTFFLLLTSVALTDLVFLVALAVRPINTHIRSPSDLSAIDLSDTPGAAISPPLLGNGHQQAAGLLNGAAATTADSNASGTLAKQSAAASAADEFGHSYGPGSYLDAAAAAAASATNGSLSGEESGASNSAHAAAANSSSRSGGSATLNSVVGRRRRFAGTTHTVKKMLEGSRVATARVKAAVSVLLALSLSSYSLYTAMQPPILISDIHLGPTIGKSFLNSVVDRVNALDPDIVLISGDLVDAHISLIRDATLPLTRLRPRIGTYYSTGNHEYVHGDVDDTLAQLASTGVHILRNDRAQIFDPAGSGEYLYVAGVDDISSGAYGLESHGHDMIKALRGINPSKEVVMIAHQPRSIFPAADLGVGLILNGHCHGNGQFAPFFIPTYIANWGYVAGLYEVKGRIPQPDTDTDMDGTPDTVVGEIVEEGIEGHKVAKLGTKSARTFGQDIEHTMYAYVNSGTGHWGPPMRLLSTSEITRITLRSAQAGN